MNNINTLQYFDASLTPLASQHSSWSSSLTGFDLRAEPLFLGSQVTSAKCFTLEKNWLGFRFGCFRGSLGKQGVEFLEEGRGEGDEREEPVEDEDFGVGDLRGESLGKRDLFLLYWDVGPNFEEDLEV